MMKRQTILQSLTELILPRKGGAGYRGTNTHTHQSRGDFINGISATKKIKQHNSIDKVMEEFGGWVIYLTMRIRKDLSEELTF